MALQTLLSKCLLDLRVELPQSQFFLFHHEFSLANAKCITSSRVASAETPKTPLGFLYITLQPQ